MSEVVRVGSRGRIVIPARVRRQLGIAAGGRVVFTKNGARIEIAALTPAYIRSFRGAFKLRPGEGSAVEELLEDRRREKTKEARW